MVPIANNNGERCRFRTRDRCSNAQVALGLIVNDSLQSRWYCAQCAHFSE